MNKASRRQFIKTTAAASVISLPAIAKSAQSANDRVRVGLVGFGGRMRSHAGCLATMTKTDNIEIVAVCDCDKRKLDSVEEHSPLLKGMKLARYDDQRKLFDDKSVDAVSFSTQDHWHALQTVWACQAGKDVYVEKPTSHNIWEGRKMVEAARKYNRMVQIGTQNRSNPNVVEGIAKLKEGVIGRLYMARGMTYKCRGNLGKHRPQPAPKELNWDAWVGPAKMVEFSNFQHSRWYWNSNFASGDIANQTSHDIDIIRWGLDLQGMPNVMMSMGGRYLPGDDDDADTPNTQAFICQWDGREVQVTFEVRHWYSNTEAGMGDKYPFVAPDQCVGVIFYGEEGYMIIPDYSSYYTFMGLKREPGPCKFKTEPIDWLTESIPHFQNWVKAIRARDHKLLAADVEEGHYSTGVCHLAKISNALKRSIHFDPKTETILNDPEASRLLRREQREPYVIPETV
jgi:predicted dehydrogenase